MTEVTAEIHLEPNHFQPEDEKSFQQDNLSSSTHKDEHFDNSDVEDRVKAVTSNLARTAGTGKGKPAKGTVTVGNLHDSIVPIASLILFVDFTNYKTNARNNETARNNERLVSFKQAERSEEIGFSLSDDMIQHSNDEILNHEFIDSTIPTHNDSASKSSDKMDIKPGVNTQDNYFNSSMNSITKPDDEDDDDDESILIAVTMGTELEGENPKSLSVTPISVNSEAHITNPASNDAMSARHPVTTASEQNADGSQSVHSGTEHRDLLITTSGKSNDLLLNAAKQEKTGNVVKATTDKNSLTKDSFTSSNKEINTNSSDAEFHETISISPNSRADDKFVEFQNGGSSTPAAGSIDARHKRETEAALREQGTTGTDRELEVGLTHSMSSTVSDINLINFDEKDLESVKNEHASEKDYINEAAEEISRISDQNSGKNKLPDNDLELSREIIADTNAKSAKVKSNISTVSAASALMLVTGVINMDMSTFKDVKHYADTIAGHKQNTESVTDHMRNAESSATSSTEDSLKEAKEAQMVAEPTSDKDSSPAAGNLTGVAAIMLETSKVAQNNQHDNATSLSVEELHSEATLNKNNDILLNAATQELTDKVVKVAIEENSSIRPSDITKTIDENSLIKDSNLSKASISTKTIETDKKGVKTETDKKLETDEKLETDKKPETDQKKPDEEKESVIDRIIAFFFGRKKKKKLEEEEEEEGEELDHADKVTDTKAFELAGDAVNAQGIDDDVTKSTEDLLNSAIVHESLLNSSQLAEKDSEKKTGEEFENFELVENKLEEINDSENIISTNEITEKMLDENIEEILDVASENRNADAIKESNKVVEDKILLRTGTIDQTISLDELDIENSSFQLNSGKVTRNTHQALVEERKRRSGSLLEEVSEERDVACENKQLYLNVSAVHRIELTQNGFQLALRMNERKYQAPESHPSDPRQQDISKQQQLQEKEIKSLQTKHRAQREHMNTTRGKTENIEQDKHDSDFNHTRADEGFQAHDSAHNLSNTKLVRPSRECRYGSTSSLEEFTPSSNQFYISVTGKEPHGSISSSQQFSPSTNQFRLSLTESEQSETRSITPDLLSRQNSSDSNNSASFSQSYGRRVQHIPKARMRRLDYNPDTSSFSVSEANGGNLQRSVSSDSVQPEHGRSWMRDSAGRWVPSDSSRRSSGQSEVSVSSSSSSSPTVRQRREMWSDSSGTASMESTSSSRFNSLDSSNGTVGHQIKGQRFTRSASERQDSTRQPDSQGRVTTIRRSSNIDRGITSTRENQQVRGANEAYIKR